MGTNLRTCSIDGCEQKHYGKGFCSKHYQRTWKHGDPGFTTNTPPGEVQEFFHNKVLTYEGDQCFLWPYSRTVFGYAQIRANGTSVAAHRIVCEVVHGEPPTEFHVAAHSCGKGHLGCVSPKHLRWATQSENQLDRVEHDTHQRGDRHPMAKLREKSVKEIKRLLAAKVPRREIAGRFGVTASAIQSIYSGRTWSWV